MAIFRDTDNKTEYSGVSVDDILAEFDDQQELSTADAGDEAPSYDYSAEYDEPGDEEVKVYRPRSREADVKLYEPGSRISHMAEGARDYVLGRIHDDFADLREEAPAESRDAYSPEDYAQEDFAGAEYIDDYGYEDYSRESDQADPGFFDAPEEDSQEYYDYGPQDFEAQGGYYEDEEPEQDFEAQDSYYEDEEPEQDFEDQEDFPEEEVEIDPRFNLGGKPVSQLRYGGEVLDTSPDASYEGNTQPDYIPVMKRDEIPDVPEGYGPEAPESEDEENPQFKGSIFSKAKKEKKPKEKKEKKSRKRKSKEEREEKAEEESFSSEFSDSADPGYAPQKDYAAAASHIEEDDFPSFKEYLLGLLTGLLYYMRNPGVASGDGSTMPDSDEDLGKELNPKQASKYYGSFVHSLKLRTRISLVLLLVLAYISLGAPLPGMLKTVKVQAAMCLCLQLGVSLMCLDVFTGAVMNAFRGRFGVDFMAVILCIVTAFDSVAVISGAFGDSHLPLCLLSSLSLTGMLISALFHAKGMRKALRVPAIATIFYAVSAEPNIKGSGLTLLKTPRPFSGFLHRSEESSPDESAYKKFSPFLLLISVLTALIICAVRKSFANFLFIFSACFVPAVPFTALLCYALPFFVGSARIFSSGAAIAGWSGLCDIGSSKNLIVTDRDLFPQGSVKIEDIRIFSNVPSEKIISYTGTMLGASGCGIASCFGELMEKNNCAPRHLENFEVLAGGGFRGMIDGQTVLCGGLEFMRLMNVHVPYKLIDSCSVLIAVDGVLYGIFNLKYTPQDPVRKALVGLMKSNRHPIFAIRDFNITPEMLRESFDIPTDGYDFPPYVERFSISEAKPGQDSKIAALVCREGLGPLTHMADTGRSMFIAARLNILISLVSCVLGIFIVMIKFLSVGFVSPGFLLGYALLFALPLLIISTFLKF